MILYRALTNEDLKELEKIQKINCTLYRSYNDIKNSKNIQKTKEMYNICYKERIEKDILSFIYGHISGKLVGSAKRSPWISLTSDYDIACKYANLDKNAPRQILCYEVDNEKIINNINDLENKKIFNGNYLNLSGNELLQYRDSGVIIPYKSNPNIPRKSHNFTLANYCKGDKEYLICYELSPENYLLISPQKQALLEQEYGKNASIQIETELKNQKTKVKKYIL